MVPTAAQETWNARLRRMGPGWGVGLVLLGVGIGAGFWGRALWSVAEGPAAVETGRPAGADHDHANASGKSHDAHEHDHEHEHEDDITLVELSQQARGNIGLKVDEVKRTTFTRTLAVPAIVVERPGQSRIEVVAPLTGVVTAIHATAGQAIEPDQPLFQMRVTHEDLVQAQAEYLRTLEELDVVEREIARLKGVSAEGVIAGKVVLEREYERQKLQAILRAAEQALTLHGLSPAQVDGIRETRKLLGAITVSTPKALPESPQRILQVETLEVDLGQQVTAGSALCHLADHTLLYVEGKAFQQEADLLNEAARNGESVCALIEMAESKPEEVCNLKILYLANKIDPESRLFSFYASLPNELVRDDRRLDGNRFVDWRFRPGQRMQLRVPVETWPDRIVLPVEAVVQDGAESYVFLEDDDHFHRCPVQVEFRDQFSVVLAEGTEIQPGNRLAMNSAQQLLLALKNRVGGGVDAHAEHDH